MKKILYLTFYFEPDLSAGSFRNTSLAKELAKKSADMAEIHLFTTQPNRYGSFQLKASENETIGNLKITRIDVPKHQSGMKDQIVSFITYYKEVIKRTKTGKYDVVFVSTGRLFSAYLGYKIAKKNKALFYIDVRDIFYDTMKDVLKNYFVKGSVLPIIKYIERQIFNQATHINLISGGFFPYFKAFKCKSLSNFSNGIDVEFLDIPATENTNHNTINERKTIVYAGNIGEGQGLDKIIPQAAKELCNEYQFIIIGDGGAKKKLCDAILKEDLQEHIELRNPVGRKELISIYNQADFLFIHLNDYKAFKKVLPSKIFELGAYDKPVIAGVSGYAHHFIEENIPNVILFKSCDIKDFVKKIKNYEYRTEVRSVFIENFKRENIDKKMVESIMSLI